MTVSLATLRTPFGVAPEQRRFAHRSLILGRGSESDWVLPDPDRVLSKRHCTVSQTDSGWQVVDSSSNGTFLNGRCLDPGVPVPLRDGDRLALAAYEIAVEIEDAPATTPGGSAEPLDRVTADPFPFEDDAAAGGIGLPQDFNVLGQDGGFGETPLVVADNASDLAAHFVPPRPSSDLIPDDWDLSVPGQPRRPPASPPAPAIPGNEEADGMRTTAAAPPPSSSLSSSPAPPAPAARTDDALAAAFALLAEAAGLDGARPAAPAEALAAVGRAFRAMVVGLRHTMIARATVKSEFRIEQTMIQASGNNPLKFSAGDDDALTAMFGVGRRSGMTAEQAVTEALRDIRLHDLAVAAAMQQAARQMLDRVDPAAVLAKLPPSRFDVLPGRRDRRAWHAAVEQHLELVRTFSDDFDGVFGRSFSRAYEQVQSEMAVSDQATDARQHGETP